MGILNIMNFDWWQVMLILGILIASPLIKALATVIIGKFVNPEIARIALPLIFQRKVSNIKIGKIEKHSGNE
ncbi:MAG: hypothetical protein ACOYU4_04525 [Thermodesulfobacteriota bacterium]